MADERAPKAPKSRPQQLAGRILAAGRVLRSPERFVDRWSAGKGAGAATLQARSIIERTRVELANRARQGNLFGGLMAAKSASGAGGGRSG